MTVIHVIMSSRLDEYHRQPENGYVFQELFRNFRKFEIGGFVLIRNNTDTRTECEH